MAAARACFFSQVKLLLFHNSYGRYLNVTVLLLRLFRLGEREREFVYLVNAHAHTQKKIQLLK